MGGVFADGADVLFSNDDRATDAVYFGVGEGEGQELRVILAFDDPNAALFQTDAVAPGNKLWARKSELPDRPLEGARFVVGARTLRVRTARVDGLDLWWICDVDEVAT